MDRVLSVMWNWLDNEDEKRVDISGQRGQVVPQENGTEEKVPANALPSQHQVLVPGQLETPDLRRVMREKRAHTGCEMRQKMKENDTNDRPLMSGLTGKYSSDWSRFTAMVEIAFVQLSLNTVFKICKFCCN